MDEQNKKRKQIKIRILCVIVAVFVITGIVYFFTIQGYLNRDDHIKIKNAPMETESIEHKSTTETSVMSEAEPVTF